MFPLSHIAPFSVPFSKGSREKRVFAQKADTTYVIKNSKLYNWIFYVGREVSGSVYLIRFFEQANKTKTGDWQKTGADWERSIELSRASHECENHELRARGFPESSI